MTLKQEEEKLREELELFNATHEWWVKEEGRTVAELKALESQPFSLEKEQCQEFLWERLGELRVKALREMNALDGMWARTQKFLRKKTNVKKKMLRSAL